MIATRATLTVDQVNYLNVGLMIASAVMAFRWPFETFLLAYILLGPLHYLTEISWLHDRHYFTRRKYDYLVLVVAALLVTVATFLPIPDTPSGTVVALYQHPIALSLMSFIAFAYLYHYLNWFSKTSVIRWSDISRARLALVVVVWVVSIGLYAYDSTMGFRWLFFLSLGHVFLEFPLNHVTFMSIGREIGGVLRVRKVGPSTG